MRSRVKFCQGRVIYNIQYTVVKWTLIPKFINESLYLKFSSHKNKWPYQGLLPPYKIDICVFFQEEARSIAEHKRKQMQTPPPPGVSNNKGITQLHSFIFLQNFDVIQRAITVVPCRRFLITFYILWYCSLYLQYKRGVLSEN